MSNKSNIEFHIPLIMAMTLMLAATLPMIGLPCCDSEARVMDESIIFLARHRTGLIYNNGFVELPDLFSVIFSQIIKYLTASHLILHAISMAWALICVWLAYKIGKYFFSVQAGVMSAALMCAQNVFLAQSGLVLPQMMLNACILGSVYMFFRERYGWCAMLSLLGTLIDIAGLAASLVMLIAYLREQHKEWQIFKNVLLAVPLLAWVGYEIASLIICGKLSIRTPEFGLVNFIENLYFIFAGQYRAGISAIIIIAIVSNMMTKRQQYFARDMLGHSSALILCLWIAGSALGREPEWNLAAICLLCIVAGCAISTMPISYYAKYAIACGLMAACSLSLLDRSSAGCHAVNYQSQVMSCQEAAQLLESQAANGDTVLCGRNFERMLRLPELGYVKNCRLNTASLDSAQRAGGRWAVITSSDSLAQSIRECGKFSQILKSDISGYCSEVLR